MQKAALTVPQGWALEGYLDVLVRGKGLSEITTEIGVLLAYAAAFGIIGLVRMSRMIRN
jgi:ABC-2 type transport system permease protein